MLPCIHDWLIWKNTHLIKEQFTFIYVKNNQKICTYIWITSEVVIQGAIQQWRYSIDDGLLQDDYVDEDVFFLWILLYALSRRSCLVYIVDTGLQVESLQAVLSTVGILSLGRGKSPAA